MVRAWLDRQVGDIESQWTGFLAQVKSSDWPRHRQRYRQQLQEMLGLSPWPQRTALQAQALPPIVREGYSVERLWFQSQPGLYVTANLYQPDDRHRPRPAVLYVCGHRNRWDGPISLGSKAGYQQFGTWFARHGIACLILDTVQYGELLGSHRGTWTEGKWWWWNRGYTPAGVEVWNAMRALDYLQSRPDIDGQRLAMAGISGGGGISWYTAALDERVQVVVPAAGITDLRNQAADGYISTHCDCMFPVNLLRWNFAMVPALIAPRPARLINGDADRHFPIDGVRRLCDRVAKVYDAMDAPDAWSPQLGVGGHGYNPGDVAAMHAWLRQAFGDADVRPLLEENPEADLCDTQLKVFTAPPADQRNSRIDAEFIPMAPPPAVPERADWPAMRSRYLERLREGPFRNLPKSSPPPEVQLKASFSAPGRNLRLFAFQPEPEIELCLWIHSPADAAAGSRPPEVRILDDEQWPRWLETFSRTFPGANLSNQKLADAGRTAQEVAPFELPLDRPVVLLSPRGVGPTAWRDEHPGHGITRAHMLLGLTPDAMRIWDLKRGLAALQRANTLEAGKVTLIGKKRMAALALYAAIDNPQVTTLALSHLPVSHDDGVFLLRVRTILDMPQVLGLALAADRRVVLHTDDPGLWQWPITLASKLDGADMLEVSNLPMAAI